MAAEVVRAAAADAGARGDVLGAVDRLDVVYCMSWPYDDPAGRLAEALGIAPRGRATTRASAARVPQQLADDRGRAIAGRRARRRRRVRGRGARHQAAAEARRGSGRPGRTGTRSRRRSRSRSPFHPGRGRPRGVPGLADLRRPRRGPPRPPGPRSGRAPPTARRAAGPDDRGGGRQPPRLVPGRALGRGADRRRPPTTAWSGYPYTKTWWRSWTSTWPRRCVLATHAAADRLGVPADRRVYLRGWALRHRRRLRGRAPRPGAQPAMAGAAAEALRRGRRRHRRRRPPRPVLVLRLVDHCSPSTRSALPIDDQRARHRHRWAAVSPAGRPANYLGHTIATMVDRLRDDPGRSGW